jgi:hypothetical protein
MSLTPEQEAKIAEDAAAEADAFEAANEAAEAEAASLAAQAAAEAFIKDAEEAAAKAAAKPTPAEQSAKAAAIRLPGGGFPDGIEVVQNGSKVVMSRGAAITRLGQGLVTLP